MWNYLDNKNLLKEKDDDFMFVKEGENFITPSNWFIDYTMTSPVYKTHQNRQFVKNAARYFYHEMMEDPEFKRDMYADELVESLTPSQKKVYDFYTPVFKQAKGATIPGYTMTEKAVNLLQLILEGADTDNIDKILSEQVQDIVRLIKEKVDDSCEEINAINKANKRFYNKPMNLKLLNKVSLLSSLSSEFKIELTKSHREVSHSIDTLIKKMSKIEQISHALVYQFPMPTFDIKLAKKDLVCRIPIDKIEAKQKIIILADYSGSMDTGEKQEWIATVMIDRMKYVVREEAEIYFSGYEKGLVGPMYHLKNKADVLKFWSEYTFQANGGDTNAGNCVKIIQNAIESKDFFGHGDLSEEKPEILLLHDGQDSIKSSFTYKTNAITLVDSQNEQLKQAALESGGIYVHIDEDYLYEFGRDNFQKKTAIKY